jgi:hypothetical protein
MHRMVVLLVALALGASAVTIFAADVDSPAAPTSAASAMYSLEDIYNRLDTGAVGTKRSGAFTEPSTGPSATRKTLDDVMAKAPAADATNGAATGDVLSGKTYWGLLPAGWGVKTGTRAPAPVQKTGQTTSFTATAGEDGDLQKGVPWPAPRFTDNGNGTITDNVTKLIWLKNANAFGTRTWEQALADCNSLATGQAGLTDGSQAGDWRLPNMTEMCSVMDFSMYDPSLPSGHPFTGVQSSDYWVSTTYANNTGNAWVVSMLNGGTHYGNAKSASRPIWPVRGGQ